MQEQAFKKIAIFGGSFDPIHNAHIAVALAAAEQAGLDELHFVTAKESPGKHNVMEPEARLYCVQQALEAAQTHTSTALFASAVELEMSSPSYSYKTIEYFQEQYPEAQIFWLMGEDAFASLDSWKKAEKFLEIQILVYPRKEKPSYAIPDLFRAKPELYRFIDAAYVDVSSSQLRTILKNRSENLEDQLIKLVPKNIWGFIAKYSWE